MSLSHRPCMRLFWLSLYAVTMAYVEAAVVVYLRELQHPHNLLAIFPPHPMAARDLRIELIREAATVFMILSVAMLAERGFVRRFAAFVYLFGLWDIFYYVWLKASIGWPVHFWEWDILFLIPWPWLGPWVTPVAISALFVGWGGRVLSVDVQYEYSVWAAGLFVAGAIIDFTAFLMPAWPLLSQGVQGFARFMPGSFPWWLFVPGYVLMVVGLTRLATPQAAPASSGAVARP